MERVGREGDEMSTSKQLAPILPSMAEAWAERDRMWAKGSHLWTEGSHLKAEGTRMWAEGDSIVIVTAQSLYGEDVQIDWGKRAVIQKEVTK